MKKFKLILILLVFPLWSFSQLSAGVNDTINPGVPVTLTATYGLLGIGINTADDGVEGPFPIGFEFSFFGNKYTQFYVGANGWIGFTFNSRYIGINEPYIVPSPSDDKNPRNCILGPFVDLNPIQSGSPYIFYRTLGQEPARSLVVMWCQCPMNSCLDSAATFQIILNEGNNTIENHIMNKPYCDWHGNKGTLGVQNNSGTIGFAIPRYNATAWNLTDSAWKYTPVTVDSFEISQIHYTLRPITPGTKITYNWNEIWSTGDIWKGDGNSIVVTPNETTTYRVNAQICSGETFTSTVTVFVNPTIPNAFNPNSNIEKNKKFKILGIPPENITQFNLQIFDRWGQIAFETDDRETGWDGTYNNQGKACPADVYFWVISYESQPTGKKVKNKGQLTLIR